MLASQRRSPWRSVSPTREPPSAPSRDTPIRTLISRHMPRKNRVDPFGDLHAEPARGLFTGNRGCLVNHAEQVVRHHGNDLLWIICRTEFRGWKHPLAAPRRWTPLFFLDDAVALAAGHRPCATCRRDDYLSFRDAVMTGRGATEALRASELNTQLRLERTEASNTIRQRGIERAHSRRLWIARSDSLPDGTMIVDANRLPHLVAGVHLYRFSFHGWVDPVERATAIGYEVPVLTPQTSVLALSNGFTPTLHPSALRTTSATNPPRQEPSTPR